MMMMITSVLTSESVKFMFLCFHIQFFSIFFIFILYICTYDICTINCTITISGNMFSVEDLGVKDDDDHVHGDEE